MVLPPVGLWGGLKESVSTTTARSEQEKLWVTVKRTGEHERTGSELQDVFTLF